MIIIFFIIKNCDCNYRLNIVYDLLFYHFYFYVWQFLLLVKLRNIIDKIKYNKNSLFYEVLENILSQI